MSNVLRALSEAHPLLLVLDDLQWVDRASIGLLFHRGRRLEGARNLLPGAYRPKEVALGTADARSGVYERHPLEKVLAEFKRLDEAPDVRDIVRGQGGELLGLRRVVCLGSSKSSSSEWGRLAVLFLNGGQAFGQYGHCQ